MAPDLNIVVILQARMGSTRLPGKVMKQIEGKPMLWHIIERLKHIKLKSKIVIATTEDRADDVIEQFCRSEGMECFRGSRKDVLDRYYKAALAHKADVVVRVTADNPLIDPVIADKVIAAYLDNAGDYDLVSNTIEATYPEGLKVEVLSFSSLEKCWKEAKEDHHREHVTIYIYEHPELFRLYNLVYDADMSYMRWTVDEERDLNFAREIYKRLYHEGSVFLMEEIFDILKREPALTKINRGKDAQ